MNVLVEAARRASTGVAVETLRSLSNTLPTGRSSSLVPALEALAPAPDMLGTEHVYAGPDGWGWVDVERGQVELHGQACSNFERVGSTQALFERGCPK